MVETVSCGGVVFHKGKVLLLYKNQCNRYSGWVMPRGTMEDNESMEETALRELKEEAGVSGKIIKYLDKTEYSFKGNDEIINKTVHWFLMTTDSFYCKPQAEEFFTDAGFYKQHEAYYLLKFHDEKQIMKLAYREYNDFRRKKEFTQKKLFKKDFRKL
ncbi:MAG: NUDIX hydrolase [Lachnospirales bacterium]